MLAESLICRRLELICVCIGFRQSQYFSKWIEVLWYYGSASEENSCKL